MKSLAWQLFLVMSRMFRRMVEASGGLQLSGDGVRCRNPGIVQVFHAHVALRTPMVLATRRSLAQTRMIVELPSRKTPTTRVLRRGFVKETRHPKSISAGLWSSHDPVGEYGSAERRRGVKVLRYP